MKQKPLQIDFMLRSCLLCSFVFLSFFFAVNMLLLMDIRHGISETCCKVMWVQEKNRLVLHNNY